MTVKVTINSDMGESFGIHSFGNDDALLPHIDTANIACGFHAGDPVGIHETVAKAAAAGVTVGAHPGLPDAVGFGRREMKLFPEEVRDLVLYQVGALKAFCDIEGVPLDHIKPHGSLYGMVARDEELMDALCDVAVHYGVPVYGMTGTAHERVAQRRDVPFVAEFYVDLGYRADGSLIIARRPHATAPELAAQRAVRALREGVAEADTGERIPVSFTSICVHSDTATAVAVAAAVRDVIESADTDVTEKGSQHG
ncbi:5-oxoprolinase subunit PxpA [Angustibacter sp. Root456]|uniref:5-oxoprolinase subunit PxpA n=1 Tax=Angustibacter sp. Root456 TaxID=1736539 RepID=UPI000A9B7180|nr:5-oxoprolinase subunit PxpA [Angustibacter sp. Root456]